MFVEDQSSISFLSFASHPYTDEQEGYKYEIYRTARSNLAFQAWKKSDIGSGDIVSSVIEAIEIDSNNLVRWPNRYGDDKRPHQPLFSAKQNPEKLKEVELCFYELYHNNNAENSFNDLMAVFGKKYALIAYLLFIKDNSKYLPIAPSYFDNAFKLLGVDFKTSHRCSWENFSTYINLIKQLQWLLSEHLSSDVKLLDAHSFAWMLSSHMERQNKLPDIEAYSKFSAKDKETVVKSRIGQGLFRQRVIDYWASCAVTGCDNINLLTASHIKPWSKSDLQECIDSYNGLLLSPAMDACFDSGLISFDDFGNILISRQLNSKDRKVLGIAKDMRLSKIEPEHKSFLAYHRENIFKES